MSDILNGKCLHHPSGCLHLLTAQSNIRALWDALAAIREAIEDVAPEGSVPNAEYADNPEPMTEAEAIIKGIAALMKAREPAPKPIMIFTGE